MDKGSRFFDYGCGRGGDGHRLRDLGFACDGWDPIYSLRAELKSADIVNLGYVINVIENEKERREALTHGWSLPESTERVDRP